MRMNPRPTQEPQGLKEPLDNRLLSVNSRLGNPKETGWCGIDPIAGVGSIACMNSLPCSVTNLGRYAHVNFLALIEPDRLLIASPRSQTLHFKTAFTRIRFNVTSPFWLLLHKELSYTSRVQSDTIKFISHVTCMGPENETARIRACIFVSIFISKALVHWYSTKRRNPENSASQLEERFCVERRRSRVSTYTVTHQCMLLKERLFDVETLCSELLGGSSVDTQLLSWSGLSVMLLHVYLFSIVLNEVKTLDHMTQLWLEKR